MAKLGKIREDCLFCAARMMTTAPRTFLASRFNLAVVLLVIFTTVFSFLNLNSWSIIAMVACRLWFESPKASIGAVFRNGLFLSYLFFCVIETAGFLHTQHPGEQWNLVAKDATLVAVGYVLCAGRLADRESWRRLLTGYYLIIVAALLYCLAAALWYYHATGDASVFFYHSLTRPISQNAVFFSVYVVFALLFVLSPGGDPMTGATIQRVRVVVRTVLIFFYLVMIVLLNSKLMLVIALLILLHAVFRKYSLRGNRLPLLLIGSILLVGIALAGLTDNPVSRRYRELAAGDLEVVRQENFNPGMYFNALQLRLLEWRFAYEIVEARQAWLFGVSPGDSQSLLDEKYISTHMYIGDTAEGPHRKVRGFIGYNFHNQYLETLVRDGLVGLAALIAIFVLLFAAARRSGTRESWFVVLTLALFFIPEAPLTMQHGLFLFCFFPLLLFNGRKMADNS
jgi:O-antigen ligase